MIHNKRRMLDTTNFMFEVFQSCRHALIRTGTALNLQLEIIEMMKHQQSYVIELPNNWIHSDDVDKRAIVTAAQPRILRILRRQSPPPLDAKLFSLIYVSTHELNRLWGLGKKQAVRRLGYALHNLPSLLRNPDHFDLESYVYSIRIAAWHWNELSVEMRRAFCEIMELEAEVTDSLVNSETIPDNFWDTLPRV
jgi:hypothetical protein